MSRNLFITSRMSDAERAMFDEIKRIYQTDNDSEMFRRMLNHIFQKRPTLAQNLPPVAERGPTEPLPYFRDIPVGTRFRKRDYRRMLWEKTEPEKPPGANHIMYNARAVTDGWQTKVGWNAKVIVEESCKQ